MPTYEYECIVCNVRYETVEKMAEHTTPHLVHWSVLTLGGKLSVIMRSI